MIRGLLSTVGSRSKRHGVSLLSAVVLLTGMTTAGVVTASPALAGTDPAHITFTLEGCRGDAGLFDIDGPFVCPDSLYTTGNLGGLQSMTVTIPEPPAGAVGLTCLVLAFAPRVRRRAPATCRSGR